jgi:Domain of unknown function (DUF5979)
MVKSPRRLLSRDRYSRIARFGCALALAVLATAALPGRADAQALFATSKNICIGVPDPINNNPNTCLAATIVGIGQPVFYVIKVTNPPGSSPQQVTLTENYPAGFVAGAIACTDPSGATVMTAINGPTIGPFNLPLATTITCTIAGSFSVAGLTNNIVDVDNKESPPQHPSVQTTVATTIQLTTDLEVTKSEAPSPIGVGTAYPLPATVTYTVKIKNIGANATNVGHWFVLHDSLALLPGSVPLYATVVGGSFTCAATATIPATDCLDTAAMNAASWTQQLIGTMAPHPMFDWSFPSGNVGHIEPGATITLTWKVKIEKLPTLSCVISLTANGLQNRVFFTLTNPEGTAANDSNNANNTASAPVVVNLTGTVDPNCGAGQLTIKKTQVTPSAASTVYFGVPPWGATGPSAPGPFFGTVTYDITIKNTAMPLQSITIPGGKLEDFVIQGLGTPPFTRTFVHATCLVSVPASICTAFNIGGGGNPPLPPTFPSTATQFPYVFYGQEQLGWNSKLTKALPLDPGDSVTIRIKFNYYGPDCETVPKVNPRLIHNKAQITYTATVVGAAAGSPDVQYTQDAIADTKMRRQPACKFVVKKTFHPGSPTTVQFGGSPLIYDVTFRNNDVSRNIGTVMDSVRITDPAYATQVPFKSSWVCTQTGGVTPLPIPAPPVFGTAIYTGSPAQGSPVFQFTNLYFNSGALLKCTVTITVERPLPNNPHCSMDPAYFENLALMDVTHPFNTNVTWPLSGTYTGGISNPTPQNRNWATLRAPLPKCYNANINKVASVNGITTNAWTSPNGPAVNYAIQVTNTGTSGALMGSGTLGAWNGLLVQDVVSPLYGSNLIKLTTASSCPGTWCTPLVPAGSATATAASSQAGVANLGLGTSASGTWGLTLQPLFTAGTYIKNCASIEPSGTFTGPGYYSNYDPANPPGSPCVQVPVLNTADLSVTKRVVNATGHTISMPSTAAGVNVVCQLYPLLSPGILTLTAGGVLALPTGGSVSSPAGVIHNVPVALGETCTVTEPVLPPIPPGVCGHSIAYWDTTILPAQPIAITTGPNGVTVTNTLRCQNSTTGSLTIIKTADYDGTLLASHPTTFPIQLSCPPMPVQTVNIVATNNGSFQQTVPNIPIGSVCTITELAPSWGSLFDGVTPANGCMWHVFYPFGQQVTITSAMQTLQVVNEEMCGGFAAPGQTIVQIEKTPIIDGLVNYTPGVGFAQQGSCTDSNGNVVITNASAHWGAASGSTFASRIVPPIGATCTWSETPPQLPPGANALCIWQTSFFYNGVLISAPGSTPTSLPQLISAPTSGPYNWLNIQNQLVCPGQTAVVIPPVTR